MEIRCCTPLGWLKGYPQADPTMAGKRLWLELVVLGWSSTIPEMALSSAVSRVMVRVKFELTRSSTIAVRTRAARIAWFHCATLTPSRR